MKKVFLCIALFVCFMINTQAQKSPMKYGKIEKADLEMSVYKKDTSASAVILCDYGHTYFNYSSEKGFQIIFERHTRIKILGKNGYSWADVSIPYYESMQGKDKISTLKGYTYNLEDGKIVKEKLEGKARFTEKINKNWSAQKFTMPNVKVGSVIEFKYAITTDFKYNFQSWQFQYSIPVIWSEYITQIPEYYSYHKT